MQAPAGAAGDRLAAPVDIPRELPSETVAALERLWSELPDARLVGGCVRDLLAGTPVHDIDLATAEPPDRVQATLQAAGIKVVPTGLAHGTVTAVIDRTPYEITTLRRDLRTDGRHAVVGWTADWREDAARRDFTINAMSVDRAGAIHDYFGGLDDLAARRVRFVGEPALRIREDALRILRFFRFDARFRPDEAAADAPALAAIRHDAGLVGGLSAERVASELLRILAGPRAVRAAVLMENADVLGRWLPLGDLRRERLAGLVASSAPPDGLLRLGGFCDSPDLARVLRLSTAQARRLDGMRAPALQPEASSDDIRRALCDASASTLIDRTWLAQAVDPGRPDTGWDSLRARISGLVRPVFPLSGRDAVRAGVEPGAMVGDVLRAVESWWRAEGCRPEREAALARLAEEIQLRRPA